MATIVNQCLEQLKNIKPNKPIHEESKAWFETRINILPSSINNKCNSTEQAYRYLIEKTPMLHEQYRARLRFLERYSLINFEA